MMGAVAMALVAGMTDPADVDAQTPTWKDVQVADIETMRDKFIGLAEAFDRSMYEWRPMEGVRSVGDVIGLAGAEGYLFPRLWGGQPPAGVGTDFGGEVTRIQALPTDALVAELRRAFDHMAASVRDMSEADRMAEGAYFGNAMPNHAVIASALTDMHEHLGQLIAYARMNQVVPPWSM